MDRSGKIRLAVEQFRAQFEQFRDGDAYRAFLDAVATFHSYGPRNACLIVAQRPNATFVRGFKSWLDLGRAVRKGEQGLTILVPRPFTNQRSGWTSPEADAARPPPHVPPYPSGERHDPGRAGGRFPRPPLPVSRSRSGPGPVPARRVLVSSRGDVLVDPE